MLRISISIGTKTLNGRYGENNIVRKFFYSNILLVGSILHAGNSVEYFKSNTETLVVFYFLGTLKEERDFIQVYEKGKLKVEKKIFAPRVPLVYHFFIYLGYAQSLIKYFSKKDTIYVITFHPLFLLFNQYIRYIRNITMVFWVADVIPSPKSFILKFYQNIIFYYHKRNKINFYLGDKLNRLMNGKLLNSKKSRTVMWGIRIEKIKFRRNYKKTVLCFVGVVRKGHGLDLAFKLLKEHKDIVIKVLGECDPALYTYYKELIVEYNITKQVQFANRFYTYKELSKELSEGTIGIGLYDTSKDDPIYYTDPGKIKTYTQFGLPVIMTNTSEIVPFIRKFKAGEITDANIASIYKKVTLIRDNYQKYLLGVNKFNNYFEYNSYYDKAFKILRS